MPPIMNAGFNPELFMIHVRREVVVVLP